ncbi:MAG: GAF domain-containing sensor histidine kinase [Nannocystaceae bacterium]
MVEGRGDEEEVGATPLTLAEVAGIVGADRVFLYDVGDRELQSQPTNWPADARSTRRTRELAERVRLGREVGLVVDRGAKICLLAAPLLLGTQLFGVVVVERVGKQPFSADDGEILAAVAERMAIDHQRQQTHALALHAEELARSEAAALAQSQAKSAFLAHMSHEIRTPLTAIIGYSELLEDEFADDGNDTHITDVQRIQAAATHLLALINNMLDLSKIEAGKMELFLEGVVIAELLNDVITTVRPVIDRGRNRLSVIVDPALGQMCVDRVKVAQILVNLLGNAGKFTRDGEIRVAAWREQIADESWIVFQIRDTGIGMSPEQVRRIFVEFAQGSEATNREHGGTGLGLALCRRLCELMGGTIDVDTGLGHGSTFRVRLPSQVLPGPSGAGAPPTA